MKVCDKTCIYCFFPIINKYFCMAKRSLFSKQSSYFIIKAFVKIILFHGIILEQLGSI